jgi:hypothetical protein
MEASKLLGGSGNSLEIAVDGVDPERLGAVADNGVEKEGCLSPRASWIEGRDVRPGGDSLSSRVERRVVDSGGDI